MRVHLARNGGIAFILVVLAAAIVLMGEQAPVAPHYRVPLVQDWTHRHMVYSAPRSIFENLQVQQQPRYVQQFLRRNVSTRGPVRAAVFDPVSILRRGTSQFQRDWGVVLAGGEKMADGTFPAKYRFDVNAAPDCTNDYVVFDTDHTGTGTARLDIYALNNLYVNGNGTGYCLGTAPNVMWAYHANLRANGAPDTSPVLSFDGTQVAWVEGASVAGVGAVLHVLRPGSGAQGTIAAPVDVSKLGATQYTTSGATYETCKAAAGLTCEIHISFNNAVDDAQSSPYYDYPYDVLYVGDNGGNLHLFTGVFDGAPQEVTTGGWPVAVHAVAAPGLTSPVYDETSGNVFVGDSLGQLSYVRTAATSAGTCGAGSPPCVGANVWAFGGAMVDAPIVDSSTGRVFEFSGTIAGAAPAGQAVLEDDTALSVGSQIATSVGSGDARAFHSGTFDQSYFNDVATGFMYVCGNSGNPTLGGSGTGANNHAEIRRLRFDASGNITGLDTPTYTATTTNVECSPVTEFYNAPNGSSSGAVDWIFFSVHNGANAVGNCSTVGCVYDMNVTNGPATLIPTSGLRESAGTSGIIVDNDSTQAGASSIYFTPLGNATATYPCGTTTTAVGCVVKATQAQLQ